MPDRRHRIATFATAAALGVTLVAAGPASAVTATGRVLPADIDKLPRGGAIEYGEIDVKLAGGAASRLSSAGTKLSGSGSATVKGKSWSFEALADSGPLDPTQMEGAAGAEGGFTAKGRKGSVKVTSLVFQPGAEKNLVGKVGKKLVELATLKGGKVTFSEQSNGLLKGAKLSLTASGAKALNAKTGGGFAKGSLGTVDIKVTNRELPLKDGVAKLSLAPGLLSTLNAQGLDITAAPPAVRNGNEVSIAITGGAFDPEGLSGRLQMEGKVTVGQAGKSVDLFGWRAAVGGKQSELFANISSSVAAPVADLDLSGFTANFGDTGTFQARGAKLKLSLIASNTIKQQFGVDVGVGTEMGTVELSGNLSGK